MTVKFQLFSTVAVTAPSNSSVMQLIAASGLTARCIVKNSVVLLCSVFTFWGRFNSQCSESFYFGTNTHTHTHRGALCNAKRHSNGLTVAVSCAGCRVPSPPTQCAAPLALLECSSVNASTRRALFSSSRAMDSVEIKF